MTSNVSCGKETTLLLPVPPSMLSLCHVERAILSFHAGAARAARKSGTLTSKNPSTRNNSVPDTAFLHDKKIKMAMFLYREGSWFSTQEIFGKIKMAMFLCRGGSWFSTQEIWKSRG